MKPSIFNTKLTIIIVSYNTKELTKQTLNSIFSKSYPFEYEVFVVDNDSTDGSVEMLKQEFPNIHLIANKENLGFSKANNQAIKRAKGNYILLLNSDTVVLEDCIEKSINYLENCQEVGVLGCKVILSDGRLDHACKRGFPTPAASFYYMLKLDKLFPKSKRFGQYDLTYLSEDEINEVDAIMGAYMLIKKQVIEKVGLLDENFFMYGEDIDWCYRIREANYKIIYYPEAKIIHYKGASGKKRRFMTIYEFHRAMYLFYNKHYRKKYSIFTTSFVYIGILAKLALTILINLCKRKG